MNAISSLRAVLSVAFAVGVSLAGASSADAAPKVKIKGNMIYDADTSQNREWRKGYHSYGQLKFHLDSKRRVDSVSAVWRCPGERFHRSVLYEELEEGFTPVKLRGRSFRFSDEVSWYNPGPGPKKTGKATIKVIGQFLNRYGKVPRKWRTPVPKAWTKGPGVPKRVGIWGFNTYASGRVEITSKKCTVKAMLMFYRKEAGGKDRMS